MGARRGHSYTPSGGLVTFPHCFPLRHINSSPLLLQTWISLNCFSWLGNKKNLCSKMAMRWICSWTVLPPFCFPLGSLYFHMRMLICLLASLLVVLVVDEHMQTQGSPPRRIHSGSPNVPFFTVISWQCLRGCFFLLLFVCLFFVFCFFFLWGSWTWPKYHMLDHWGHGYDDFIE